MTPRPNPPGRSARCARSTLATPPPTLSVSSTMGPASSPPCRLFAHNVRSYTFFVYHRRLGPYG